MFQQRARPKKRKDRISPRSTPDSFFEQPRELRGKDFFECEEFPLSIFRMPSHEGLNSVHCHDFDELMIVVGGSATHHTIHKTTVLRRGDVYFIPSGAIHSYETEPAEKLEVVNILFDHSRLPLGGLDLNQIPAFGSFFQSDSKRSMVPPPLELDEPGMAQVMLCINQMEAELSEQSPGYLSMTFSYFVRLLCLLLRLGGVCPLSMNPPEVLKLRSLVAHLEENLTQSFSVMEMADFLGVSPSYLRILFHRAYSQSPVHFLNRLRIGRAIELLVNQDCSVTEAAFKVGFNDSNYFTRVFHRYLGKSPKSFRKQVLNA